YIAFAGYFVDAHIQNIHLAAYGNMVMTRLLLMIPFSYGIVADGDANDIIDGLVIGLLADATSFLMHGQIDKEVASDITICIGNISFQIHKFPLVSKCGYIKKLLSDYKNTDLLVVEIPYVSGGPEEVELAAKCCYEANIELSTENIALARCVAEYIEMTEEFANRNWFLQPRIIYMKLDL
ncbi:BTB/POZ domain-containing protein-like protein, partial [Tanacetum coccineum]